MNIQAKNDAKLDCRRNGVRIEMKRSCVLHHYDIEYPCVISNFSISGVLVSVPNIPPSAIKIGDTCGLSFSGDPAMYSEKYLSKVARMGNSNIGLHFLSITF
jgi:hypothetical protein